MGYDNQIGILPTIAQRASERGALS